MHEDDRPARQQPPIGVTILQVLALLVLIAIRFAEPVGDGDLFWQMAYGKYMLEHHTLVPDHTIYSWTPADNPYIYCSWFAEISLYLMHQLGGLPLLFAFRYAVIIYTVGLAYNFAAQIGWQRRAEFWFLATWFVSASYVGTILKPELFSLGFMSTLAWLIFRFRLAVDRQQPFQRYLVGMVLVIALWANSHGVFLFGLTALGAYAVGELLNVLIQPDLALRQAARKPLLATLAACGLASFCTPYGYSFVLQSINEFLSIATQSQSAGDKAAYQSLAAHLPIWKALAFHFHEYLAVGSLMGIVILVWMLFHGPRQGKVDFVFLLLNLWFGFIFTIYLRSTFYWPPFFLYSVLYLLYQLAKNPRQTTLAEDRLWVADFLVVGANMALLRFYYDAETLGSMAAYLRMPAEDAIKLLTLGGVVSQTFVTMVYTAWRVLFSSSEDEEDAGPIALGVDVTHTRGTRLGYLQPRMWLTCLAVVSQLYLCINNSREAIFVPYASSWCGFGITYWNPVDEVEFIKKYHPKIKTIINDYDSGGYLIWSLYPQTKVMIDPRSFPYRKFWADYIAYEHGKIGLEFLDRFSEHPDVCLVSLKNMSLWRTYLSSKDWVPGWVGTAYIVFVKRGFTYPADAAMFRPGRFETLRNAQKCLHIYQFGIESNLFDVSWQVLDVMKRKFNTTPLEKKLVANLEAFKESIVALQANDLDKAIEAQERCLGFGQFVNAQLLSNMYKLKLQRIKQQKGESSPEYQEIVQRHDNLVRAVNRLQQ